MCLDILRVGLVVPIVLILAVVVLSAFFELVVVAPPVLVVVIWLVAVGLVASSVVRLTSALRHS